MFEITVMLIYVIIFAGLFLFATDTIHDVSGKLDYTESEKERKRLSMHNVNLIQKIKELNKKIKNLESVNHDMEYNHRELTKS